MEVNKHEDRLIISENIKFIVGVDEAGRGALAGPVSVGIFAWPLSQGPLSEALTEYPVGRDSKKLTPKMRDKWFDQIIALTKKTSATGKVSLISSDYIDRAGIVAAVSAGIQDCLLDFNPKAEEVLVLLDGGLKAPEIFANQQTIIKGDEKEMVISLASILAKVSRDRKMVELAKKYPNYDFALHKGYGTSLHYQKIREHGSSVIHRKTYLH